MQFLKGTGFVIKRTNSGEADKFIYLYTQEHGKIELVAKGVRKIKSRRASSIELLNLVTFQAVKTRKNFILTEVVVLNTFEHIKDDFSQIQVVFFVCELINALCPPSQVNESVYNLLYQTLLTLDKKSQEDQTLVFQVELLKHLGFWNGSFKNPTHSELKSYIESIIEKKVKTQLYFEDKL